MYEYDAEILYKMYNCSHAVCIQMASDNPSMNYVDLNRQIKVKII